MNNLELRRDDYRYLQRLLAGSILERGQLVVPERALLPGRGGVADHVLEVCRAALKHVDSLVGAAGEDVIGRGRVAGHRGDAGGLQDHVARRSVARPARRPAHRPAHRPVGRFSRRSTSSTARLALQKIDPGQARKTAVRPAPS